MGQDLSKDMMTADDISPKTLKSRSISAVAELIKKGKAPRIVVMTGAGVSTSAGIPDFRSPKTGLYANLGKFDLPYPEAVFDLSYFRKNPKPFYTLAGEMEVGKFSPTVAHAFIALLEKKGLLHMLFTQNIDCLDRKAGVPADKIVEAHGSWATQRCIKCLTAFPDDLMQSAVRSGEVPHCVSEECDGLVKPDVVFFGEPLPESFRNHAPKVAEADLVIVMGTSLQVQPFASLPSLASDGVPRVLINLERVGGMGSRTDDVLILTDCDSGVRNLADALGWREDLEVLWRQVSGKESHGDEEELAKASKGEGPKTKDERLEEMIDNLARDVDHTLTLLTDQKKLLERQAARKDAVNSPAASGSSSGSGSSTERSSTPGN